MFEKAPGNVLFYNYLKHTHTGAIDNLTKTSAPRVGASLGTVGQRPSKDPKTKQAIAIVLGCFPELEHKGLLLSTHALWTEEVEESSWH